LDAGQCDLYWSSRDMTTMGRRVDRDISARPTRWSDDRLSGATSPHTSFQDHVRGQATGVTLSPTTPVGHLGYQQDCGDREGSGSARRVVAFLVYFTMLCRGTGVLGQFPLGGRGPSTLGRSHRQACLRVAIRSAGDLKHSHASTTHAVARLNVWHQSWASPRSLISGLLLFSLITHAFAQARRPGIIADSAPVIRGSPVLLCVATLKQLPPLTDSAFASTFNPLTVPHSTRSRAHRRRAKQSGRQLDARSLTHFAGWLTPAVSRWPIGFPRNKAGYSVMANKAPSTHCVHFAPRFTVTGYGRLAQPRPCGKRVASSHSCEPRRARGPSKIGDPRRGGKIGRSCTLAPRGVPMDSSLSFRLHAYPCGSP
jgi:hypothetical protein